VTAPAGTVDGLAIASSGLRLVPVRSELPARRRPFLAFRTVDGHEIVTGGAVRTAALTLEAR
jgi:hypothetical protein